MVYSNLPEADLFKKFVDHKAIWDVPFKEGKNLLFAKSINEKMIDELVVDFHLQPYFLNNPSFKSIAINFGSQEYFIEEPTGLVWEPERKYTKGYWGYIKVNDVDYKHPGRFDVKRTTSDPLYYSYLKNAESIQFDVADGNYEVELLFVNQIPENKFSVLVNDNPVYNYPLESLEKTAINIKTFVEAIGDRGIRISFNKEQGNTIISGIKIRKNF